MGKLLNRSKLFLERNSSTILTCIGGIGVIATSVLAVKATPKALELLKEAEEEKGSELTKLEVVKTAGPVYIPAVIAGVSTLACIFSANTLNKRQQAAITSAYALLDSSYKEYKKKVEELYGEGTDHRVKQEMAKDAYEDADISVSGENQLFFDSLSMRYFESTMENVIRAEYEINKKIQLNGGAHLNEFYELLDIPAVDYGKFLGWSTGLLMEQTWFNWLDFQNEKVVMDDGLECYVITMSTEPLYDFEYY